LQDAGVMVATETYFDTIEAVVPGRADAVVAAALERGINIWRIDDDHVSVSVDETTTQVDLDAVASAFSAGTVTVASAAPTWPHALRRTSAFLTHPVFHSHHSETAMLRYLRTLADRDYALDCGMIPLGSCTMKLNATTEMEAITWPEFANLHPFAPADQTEG